MPTIFIILLAIIISIIVIDPEKKVLNDSIRRDLGKEFAHLPNGSVHYELARGGKDTTVVLVHGFSVPSYIWDPTFSALYAAGYTVLRFDLFGRGYSDRPDVDYDLGLFKGQLKDMLDVLEINAPIHLIGLSMGGPITAGFTHLYPENVRSLTLIDPLVAPFSHKKVLPLLIKGLGEAIMTVYGEPFMFPKAQRDDLHEPDRFPDWVKKFKEQIRFKGFRRAILSTMRNLTKMDALPDYAALTMLDIPVLLLRGAEDRTIPEEQMHLLRELVREIEFHQIEEAGHIPHYEKPDVVNPILLEFIRNN